MNFISLNETSNLEETVKNKSIANPCCLQGAISFRTTINGKTAMHKVKTFRQKWGEESQRLRRHVN
jgi:hypothetical protein